MPKSRKSARVKKTQAQQNSGAPSRRTFLGYGALGAGVVAAGGFWSVSSFRTYAAEHDLGQVGQGNPTVVQIHDPQCPTCTALQKQTRAALRDFDDCGLTYLIADIKTPEGAAFARKYNVPHVTLLLFDGEGELHATIQGMHQSAQLAQAFAAHKAKIATA